MAFTASQLELLTSWCAKAAELAESRREAGRTFFATDDPRPVRYWPGADDGQTKGRRFLGWFLFSFRLPDGTSPAELAVQRIASGASRAEALQAVQNARYVFAVVNTAIPGRGVILEIEDERFDVRSSPWSHELERGRGVVCYLVPSHGRNIWIPGPGWLAWPVAIGPNMRANLKLMQSEPLAIERVLQSRSDPTAPAPTEVRPTDATLAEAVARMTQAATAAKLTTLILSVDEWAALVIDHMGRESPISFSQEVIHRVGNAENLEVLNRWIGLGTNIWNNTPQPDRGGRTANEMMPGR